MLKVATRIFVFLTIGTAIVMGVVAGTPTRKNTGQTVSQKEFCLEGVGFDYWLGLSPNVDACSEDYIKSVAETALAGELEKQGVRVVPFNQNKSDSYKRLHFTVQCVVLHDSYRINGDTALVIITSAYEKCTRGNTEWQLDIGGLSTFASVNWDDNTSVRDAIQKQVPDQAKKLLAIYNDRYK